MVTHWYKNAVCRGCAVPLLVDSPPADCAHSRETLKRPAPDDPADYRYYATHSRHLWGFRLHAIFTPDATPRAPTIASPKRNQQNVALELLAHTPPVKAR